MAAIAPPRDPAMMASLRIAGIIREKGPLSWKELEMQAGVAGIKRHVLHRALEIALTVNLIDAKFSIPEKKADEIP